MESGPLRQALSTLSFSSARFEMRALKAHDFVRWKRAMLQMKKKQNKFDDAVLTSKQIELDFFQKFQRRMTHYRRRNLIYHYGIFDKQNGDLIGDIYVSLIQRFNIQSARISYGVFNNLWRKGIGRESVVATVHFAFKKLKLHRLEAEIQPDNKASIALAKKVGFRKEGYRRKAVYFDGDWHDHVVYSIIASDVGLKNAKPAVKS